MKAFSVLRSPSRSRYLFFVFAALIFEIVSLLSACDYNVELNDERRILQRIEGNQRCEPEKRVAKGGRLQFRLYLVDNRRSALALDGIDQAPLNLKIDNFSIDKNSIKVLDFETGKEISGASATLTIDKSKPLVVQPNLRYNELKESIGNRRVPKAVSLLIDMSEMAANQDHGRTRASAAASWVLDNFNDDSAVGDLDVFQGVLIRNGTLSNSDNMFVSEEEQYTAANGRKRGFILTEDNAKTMISEALTNLLPSQIKGDPPIYEGIEAAAYDLRMISRESEEPLFNPMVIAISLERDVNIIKKKSSLKKKVENTYAALKGDNFEEYRDFVPVVSIVYPRPGDVKEDEWNKHLDNLCYFAKAAGNNKEVYWGNLFRLIPGQNAYQDNMTNRLNMAYHSMGGYVQIELKYSLSGNVKAGNKYIVTFSMLADFLGEKIKNDPDVPLPKLSFVVEK